MFTTDTRRLSLVLTLLLGLAGALPSVQAQQPGEQETVAIAGEPFGVARLAIQIPPGASAQQPGVEGFLIEEKNQRVFYPAFSKEPVRGMFRNLLNRPQRVTAWFLFRGNQPLELNLAGDAGQPVVLQPRNDPAGHQQLLQAWWRGYAGDRAIVRLIDTSEPPPPQVKNYLTAMLGQRLNLRLPRADELGAPTLDDPLGLMLGTEDVRLRLQQEGFVRGARQLERADQPLPAPIELPAFAAPLPPEKIAVEPIALHVPAECFYVRFGSYANFQWMRTFLTDVGGDLRNLISVRGVDYGLNQRMERQLVLKSSVLGELFGGLAISDVAMIGHDTFLREGAAIGVLFEAKNGTLLAANFDQQRKALLAQDPRATEKKVEIAGRQVSLLSTPDNSVRSFYAVDGDYHLVATSQTLIRRFFEAGAQQRSLGQATEFIVARAGMPVKREDTIFAYLSTPFMQQLISPQYRLEITRRLQASGDIELLHLARLAAKGEGQPHATVEQLVAGGFLPPRFGQRPDGSRTTIDEQGVIADSLRGGRGSFIPVMDLPIDAASPAELAAYDALARYTHSQVQHLEPVVATIKRNPIAGQTIDRVVVDLRMSPFADHQFSFLTEWLGNGAPDQKRLRPVPGDLVAIEAILGGQHLFAGLRDCNPARIFGGQNLVETLLGALGGSTLDNLQGYVGAAASDGALDFLGQRQYTPPDPQGYAQSTTGLIWRRQTGPYFVLSFHRGVLEEVTPRLEFEEALRPAQARVRIADLRNTQLADYADSLGVKRAEAASRGNTLLLNSLIQQLHVPPAECLTSTETMLGARLVSPLGGKYVLSDPARADRSLWVVAADEPPAANGAPARLPGYKNPVLNWFRGLDGDVLLEGRTMLGHFEIDMERPPAKSPFNGLNGLNNLIPNGNGAAPKGK